MHILGIITARGGSKRIPNKNIKLLNKKPLITYTFNAAEKSKLLSKTILSTDSLKIIDIAKKFKNIEIPFIRPKYLSKDNTPSFPVIKHAVLKYEKLFTKPDIIVLLQPTSPFRTDKHIDSAIRKFQKYKTDSLVSINQTSYSPELDYFLNYKKNNLKIVERDNIKKTKHYNKIYVRNGAIYIFTYNCLIHQESLYGKKMTGLLMNKNESIDINNFDDWKKAANIANKKL